MHTFLRITAVALVAAACGLAHADTASATAIRFVSGGASAEDFVILNQQAADYSLKLLFAAKGSGAYLADVHVTVTSLPSQQMVLDTRTEGPMLLAALPAGRYQVNASYSDVSPGAAATLSRTVVVSSRGRVSHIMYFSTADAVSAESPREFQTGR